MTKEAIAAVYPSPKQTEEIKPRMSDLNPPKHEVTSLKNTERGRKIDQKMEDLSYSEEN